MRALLAVLLALASAAKAADFVGSAAPYLYSGVGARMLGMGGAGVALTDDVSSAYWNPAGLSRMGLHPTQIASMYSFLSLERSLNYFAMGQHTEDFGNIAVGLTHYGVEGIERYDTVGSSLGTFLDQEFAMSLSYANAVNYQFRWGATVRGLYNSLADAKAFGYGGDLGVLYQPSLSSEFTIGINAQNPLGAVTWDSGRQEAIAPNLKIGLADKYFNARMSVAADLDVPLGVDGPMTPHLGAELWLAEGLAARAGLNRRDFTAGGTWKYEFYQIDYAFVFNSRQLGDTHQVSLTLLF